MIMTMWADHPKWSYVRFDARGRPCEVVEKKVVSNEATVGIYNFRRGADFVLAAESMIVAWEGTPRCTLVSPAHHLRTHLSHCTALPSGLVFSAGVLRDVGGMDERLRFLCDWDLFCRMLLDQIEKRKLIARLSLGLVGWRVHGNSVTGRLWRTHFSEHELFMREFSDSHRVKRLRLFTAYEDRRFHDTGDAYRYRRLWNDYRQLRFRDKVRFAPWFLARCMTRTGLRVALPAVRSRIRQAIARRVRRGVDLSSEAMKKMPICAAFGVPEVWRYDGRTLQVFELAPDGTYRACDSSTSLPRLPILELQRLLARVGVVHENALVRSFRTWIRQNILPG